MSKTQDLKHHASVDRAYLFTLAVLAANLIIVLVHMVHARSFWNVWLVVLSLVIFVPFLRVRQYPIKVQDRLIRLEERLRLQALAPAAWSPNILLLTEDQLIGLRFASDDEVVALAQQALSEQLNRKQIKERIRVWRPDTWRV